MTATETLQKQVIAQTPVTTYQNLSSLSTIGTVTVGGAMLGGPTGALIGLVSSVFDEYMIKIETYSKHYASTTAFWAFGPLTSCFSVLQSAQMGISTSAVPHISVIGGLVLSYLTEDFVDFRQKLELPVEAFGLINQMFDEHNIVSSKELSDITALLMNDPQKALNRILYDLNEICNNPFVRMLLKSTAINLAKFGVNLLFLRYLSTYATNLFIVNLLEKHENVAALTELSQNSNLMKEARKILTYYFFKALATHGLDYYEAKVSAEQYQIVLDKSMELIITDGRGRKILNEKGGKELVRNLTPDLTKLMYRGANRLNYVFTDTISALSSLYTLSHKHLAALGAYFPLSIPFQYAIRYLNRLMKESFRKNRDLEDHFWDVKHSIPNSITQINLRGGDLFVKRQYTDALNAQNNLTLRMTHIEQLQGAVKAAKTLSQYAIDAFYWFILHSKKIAKLPEVPLIYESVTKVYDYTYAPLYLEMNSKEVLLAKERVKRAFEIIANTNSSNLTKKPASELGNFVVEDYSLNLYGNEILNIPRLEFETGKRYALTGKSGCGKSSFLIDLQLGLLKPFSSTGTVHIEGNKRMFIDQDVYLPVNSTLFETLCFPNPADETLRDQVISLFKELEIDKFTEEGRDDVGLLAKLDSDNFQLSGGQEKKVAFIQAILSKPDILFMDETFTGLDPKSLVLVQEALQKYLPNTTIICVDHHANEPISSKFYDKEIHFKNGSISV